MVEPLHHEFSYDAMVLPCNDDQAFHPLVCSPWMTLIHPLDGHITLHAHQQTHELTNDELVVIGKEMDYRLIANDHGNALIIKLDPSLIASDPQSLIYRRFIQPILSMSQGIWLFDDPTMINLVDRLNDHSIIQSHYHLHVLSTITQLWSILYDALMMTPVWVKASDETGRSGLIRWVHLHYASNASINVWAKAYHMSRSDFDHYFGLTYGTSALTYWNHYKVFKSLDLLTQTDLPIRLIAQQVGFESGSYYATVFRQYMGISPREYRENHKS